MASTRAEEVAEILWELKRAGKISTYTNIARRAGFSAGANGRALDTCLRVVRRDWPHLEWWRAVRDNGVLELDSEQQKLLAGAGYTVELAGNGKSAVVVGYEGHVMTWPGVVDGAAEVSAEAAS